MGTISSADQANSCLGCGAALGEPFLDLGTTPLANSYIKPELADQPEPRYRLAVAYCGSCHLVQLTDHVPPQHLFSEYLYFSSYSESYLEHASRMASSLIRRLRLNTSSRVVEVASNDGYLLQYFQRRGIPVRGVEPAANIAMHAIRKGIPTYNRFFDSEAARDILATFGPADLLIGNNVLAHVPQINDFLLAVKAVLANTGCAVFEFPHVLELLRHVEFDTIYHEHVFYYSLSAVQILANRAGLEIFDVERQPVHGGSLRVFLQPRPYRPVHPSVEAVLEEERLEGLTGPDRWASFSEQVANLRSDLLELLCGLKRERKRVAAYGAPAKGNTLLNYCQIGTDLIEFTVDRSPYKQNLLLPGSRIPIYAPEALEREMPDYVLILPWNVSREIISQQADYRRRGGKFIVPIPKPRILDSIEDTVAATVCS